MKYAAVGLVLQGLNAASSQLLRFARSIEPAPSYAFKRLNSTAVVIEEKKEETEGDSPARWLLCRPVDDGENGPVYKVQVQDPVVFSLLHEEQQYVISASAFQEDVQYGFVYKLKQVSTYDTRIFDKPEVREAEEDEEETPDVEGDMEDTLEKDDIEKVER
ncbi:hypothetical protein [Alkalicoccus chagannorensis]|uniref:hypothetical protein n=1 Tax=Alkalicoccus chagannorensis TaxID=427072 RepID=UPI000413ECF9|nr:hypothetical protein [Alkalicoccus chagannorensis]